MQKILRLVEEIEFEDPGTVRDRINRAEKHGFIDDAAKLIEIRKLRNDIVHQYISEFLKNYFSKLLDLSPVLFETADKIKNHCKKYFKK